MITNAGGGYSHWKDIAVTRWREDVTCDNWGAFCYIRDAENGNFWSATYQPTLKKPEKYEAYFQKDVQNFAVAIMILTHILKLLSPLKTTLNCEGSD